MKKQLSRELNHQHIDHKMQEWKEKVSTHFNSYDHLTQFLFETMNNFYYRFLETSQNRDLKTGPLSSQLWGAQSFETSMVEALKIKNPLAKKGIIELAKSVPGGKGVAVRYSLAVEIRELTPEKGKLHFTSQISWDYPEFKDPTKQVFHEILFEYSDLNHFRKNLALTLEEICEIFL